MAKMGEGTPTLGRQVVMHLASGDAPAIVTRVNPDDSLSLTVFAVQDILFRDNVQQYEFEEGDGDEEKVGYWEWPERT